jgi:hypothetical protein
MILALLLCHYVTLITSSQNIYLTFLQISQLAAPITAAYSEVVIVMKEKIYYSEHHRQAYASDEQNLL